MNQNTLTINKPFEDLDYFNIDEYTHQGLIGSSNAPVYRYVNLNNDNQYFALKELKIRDDEDNKRVQESFKKLQTIKQNKHPYIVEIYGFCKVIKQKAFGEDISACLIMEYCDGNLDDYIQMKKKKGESFTETEIKKFFSQTLSALEFLQNNISIAHRDIKPENILVHQSNFKIADLDDSKIDLNKTVEKSLVLGTISFMAPELLKAHQRMKERLSYNAYRSDVYSLGLCLLYMCTFHKFSKDDRIDSVTNKQKYQEKIKLQRQCVKQKYGSALSKFLKVMLEMDPILRPDFETLKKQTIEKGFFEKQDFFAIENKQVQKRQQISIDLNRQHIYDSKQVKVRPHCILSDSDGTTAHYSSDNQETSKSSQKKEQYMSQQQNQYLYNYPQEQIFHQNMQNTRQPQIVQTQGKTKALSISFAQGGSHRYIPTIHDFEKTRFSDGNANQMASSAGNPNYKLSIDQQNELQEHQNLNIGLQKKQSSSEQNNAAYIVNQQTINERNINKIESPGLISVNQNRQFQYREAIFEPIQEDSSITQKDERSNTDRTASNQSNCFYQGNNQIKTVSQTMLDSRTVSQMSYANNETHSQQNNSLYPESQISEISVAERQNTFTVSEIFRENQNIKFQQQISNNPQNNNDAVYLKNNEYIKNNNDNYNKNIENLNNENYNNNKNNYNTKNNNKHNQNISHNQESISFNLVEETFKDQNQNKQQQLQKQQIYQKLLNNNQGNQDAINANLGIKGQQSAQVNPFSDKLSNSKTKRKSQKQQINQKDINIYDDANQNTCITQKKKGNNNNLNSTNNMPNKNNKISNIEEQDSNFFGTFLESSTQTPLNQDTINSLIDCNEQNDEKYRKRRYNEFQNPDQIRKLSKQRKTLAILIIIMILLSISLGLFYFIQQSSINGNSSDTDDGEADNSQKTYTVDQCKQMNKVYLQGKCYIKCPQQNYYLDQDQSICIQCDPTCLECSLGEVNSCKKCGGDRYLLSLNSNTGMCVQDCPNYFRKDSLLNKCIKCTENCLSCSVVQPNQSEDTNKNISYIDNSTAQQVTCSSCAYEYFLLGDNLCINICPKETTPDYENRKCVPLEIAEDGEEVIEN